MSNLVHENTASVVWSSTACHTKTRIFFQENSLINFRRQKCLSRGRLTKEEQKSLRNKQRDPLSFAELDWLIRTINSIRVGLFAKLWSSKQRNWDYLNQPIIWLPEECFEVDFRWLSESDSSDCFLSPTMMLEYKSSSRLDRCSLAEGF